MSNAAMDVDSAKPFETEKADAKVVVVTNLTRNVVESHLQTVFGFYGEIIKVDLPLFGKSGQNRGKAALEYVDAASAHRAQSHMDGGQLDGAVLKVELSDLPVRSRSRSPPPPPRTRRAIPPAHRNGRNRSYSPRSRSRSLTPRSRSRSRSYSRSRSRSPPSRRRVGPVGSRDTYRGRGGWGRRGLPQSHFRDRRSRTRTPLPIRRGNLPPRRRSPSYTRGGYGGPDRDRGGYGGNGPRGRGRPISRSYSRSRSPLSPRSRSRSASYSVRSSRSRTRSLTRSRSISRAISRSRSRSRTRSKSRGRSMSYSSYSRYSRSRSRTPPRATAVKDRSVSRGRSISKDRDDIRDSRSRSPEK